jgi:25S rRNA (adenine2142-N1)-methyltransferase
MAKEKKKSSKLKSLSHGRPPVATTAKPRPAHLSSQTTRTVIRKHHNLLKAHARAVTVKDASLAEELAREIVDNGGLAQYQEASKLGQSVQRGGDTSRHLLDFLAPVRDELKLKPQEVGGYRKLRMLDVGALSTDTAASRSGFFEIERIDLNSQEKDILQQDFMQRPLPRNNKQRFDIVCLSLVVNYVPDAKGRGDMLKRVSRFLLRAAGNMVAEENEHKMKLERKQDLSSMFPALWLVLPAPCVTNSRYMTSSRLVGIMNSLGYVQLATKTSAKLAYFLFRWTGREHEDKTCAKVEVNPGKARNNFVILVE